MARKKASDEKRGGWLRTPYVEGALQMGGSGTLLLMVLLASVYFLNPESAEPGQLSDAEQRELEQLRAHGIAPEGTILRWQEVDYAEGVNAAWWPRVEPDILRESVATGKLAPVADRVGPEPLVLEGPETHPEYGGTWFRAALSLNDASTILYRMGTPNLVRWSEQGYPIVPHLARDFTVSEDKRIFTFYLRCGIHWSDGAPMDANDLLYWWEKEASDTRMRKIVPEVMRVGSAEGRVEKIDDYTVRFVFPVPNGLFLEKLASFRGIEVVSAPRHYLAPFHPYDGDMDQIAAEMERRQMPSPRALYRALKENHNPSHPRLWAWIYKDEPRVPPYSAVRNPYYFAVDTAGRQLPYIDRIFFNQQSGDLIGVSAASGELSMQDRHLRFSQYTLLMDQRKANGYAVRHWLGGDASLYVIHPNLNRKVQENQPETKWKAKLLGDANFRRALSLAINRKDILRAEFGGLSTPSQVGPPEASPFYDEKLLKRWTDYAPEQANAMLDELGLTNRDSDGFRTFPDGSRMLFYINVTPIIGSGPAQLVAEDWRSVGIRVQVRERSRELSRLEIDTLVHDFCVWFSNGEYLPLLEPRALVPLSSYSDFARGWGTWYLRGGYYGREVTERGAFPPPENHPIWKSYELYDALNAATTREEQVPLVNQMLDIATDQLWTINLGSAPPYLAVVDEQFKNVPEKAVYSYDFLSPGNYSPELFFIEKSGQTLNEESLLQPRNAADVEPSNTPLVKTNAADPTDNLGNLISRIIKWVLVTILLASIALIALRYAFIGRRLLLMIPTLFIVSIVNFTIIQAPPGDYLTTLINQLQESGDSADLQRIEDLREIFHLNEGVVQRYMRWSGLYWFVSFSSEDKGLLQGNMGRSMETLETVNSVVGDRILLTLFISAGTILFTWCIALPLGIYSAVRQYSPGDYIASLIGFIGMCIPNFLLALVLMYISGRYFGITTVGLFSPEYAADPNWSWGKFVDLLQHIWIPVIVVGTGGTAQMLRIMRGNLLDELKKPYVVTARAKGVRPLRLLLKYPVRLALNPFVSVLGNIFPQLVSGSAIVALILSLPTVGPLMLASLLNQDMYLAGSMLMVLSLLGVAGTLISDILLVLLDPRIRMEEGGAK